MNKYEADILIYIIKNGMQNQRIIAEDTNNSLGTVNKAIKSLCAKGYIDEEGHLKENTKELICDSTPKNAIILAAGYGMRMVPINTEIPKGLLNVRGDILIERTIRQLKESGIEKIYVVVGYMKEAYEYLIDDFGVELIVNSNYFSKNNLHSLALASEHIGNTYIIPCDIWCEDNPYSKHEFYSWYMVSDSHDEHSNIRVNRKNEIIQSSQGNFGNAMIGIAYINKQDGEILKANLKSMDKDRKYDFSFWEDALTTNGKMNVIAKIDKLGKYIEINTYEQLREIDTESGSLKSDAIEEICKALDVSSKEITSIEVLKKGMTNRSFLFSCNNKRYIMRIPGEGTSELINRKNEAKVYGVLDGTGICDDIAYINPENGYKITEYLENARVCDADNREDLARCMDKLREFHNKNLIVDHEFDIFSQIEFYESLWNGTKSIYRDYETTKENVMSLKEYIEKHCDRKCLSHIDAVPDNFLLHNNNGNEEIRLIDWEYAGMQDPHVDIAMFCIYAMYDRKQIDELIDIYFKDKCLPEIRKKIYCYIASCGLLWSNWCEYKRQLGVEFGEYSLKQYRYAKEYYSIAKEMQMNE